MTISKTTTCLEYFFTSYSDKKTIINDNTKQIEIATMLKALTRTPSASGAPQATIIKQTPE